MLSFGEKTLQSRCLLKSEIFYLDVVIFYCLSQMKYGFLAPALFLVGRIAEFSEGAGLGGRPAPVGIVFYIAGLMVTLSQWIVLNL